MPPNSIAYRAAIAEALMREHHRSWHDAFETAEGITATYLAEGISPEVAALLWVRYTTRTASPRNQLASHDLAGGHMPSSYTYTSGSTRVVCATLLLADSRYCGNFVAVTTGPDGHREIHERTCPGWNSTLDEALSCARAMAESIYPPTPQPHQQSSFVT